MLQERESKVPNPKPQISRKSQPSILKSVMHYYLGIWHFEICLELGVWDLEPIIGCVPNPQS
jgi:hypothetical protein